MFKKKDPNRMDASRPTELKRVVGIWGSFSMGYADVGADVYIALGLIAIYAAGAAPIALLLAAITYVATGLCYAELASTYPVAGGAQFYSTKAFGQLHGFFAGWGLMLDYTIDIALFALASTGYVGFLGKIFFHSDLFLKSPYYGLVAIVLIVSLIALNLVGLKWSSRFNIFFVFLNLVTMSVIIFIGLPIIAGNGAISSWFSNISTIGTHPSWRDFAFATSLAIVSYIGIESISQAAEETKHPARVIPTATKAAIVAVIIISVSLSLLSVTLLSPSTVASRSQDPMIALASAIPFIGPPLAIWVAFMGFAICYVSTNTGVIGVSRVTFSMGRLKLMPSSFQKLHSKYRTPYTTIMLFSAIAILIILANVFLPAIDLLNLVASLYNFGALIAYMYVNLSLIALRNSDLTQRAWKIPGSIHIRASSKVYEIPLLPVVGFVSCLVVWIIIVGTHELGRLLGTLWFVAGLIGYIWYRRKLKLPLNREAKRDIV